MNQLFEFYFIKVFIITYSYINVFRIRFVGEFVNAPWLIVCSSREMVTVTVKVLKMLDRFSCVKSENQQFFLSAQKCPGT